LVFKLERAGHPRRYDDRARFRKGAKRVNGLRLLADDGLPAQDRLLVRDGPAARELGSEAGLEEGVGTATNDRFAPAIES
jgi:hypothetical protein